MCDYSLEMYQSRAAEAGDKLVTRMFPTGSVGMVAQGGDRDCAVCIASDTVLKLDLSGPERQPMRDRFGLKEVEAVTFVHLDFGIHRDGVRFENGVELSLQKLPIGIAVEVVNPVALTAPVQEEPAYAPV